MQTLQRHSCAWQTITSAIAGRLRHAGLRALACALFAGLLGLSGGCRLMQSGAQVSSNDQQFMLTAASVGTAEIDLGKLASQRGADPKVRAFGEHMVAEHTRINDELTGIAHQKDVRLLMAMDQANRTLCDELKALSGPEFDREYAIAQVHIHRMGNALYGSEATDGEDTDVKAFAARGVPIGQNHLLHAERLLQDVSAR
jgi:putative membrane protein